jgi:hypothetical protein
MPLTKREKLMTNLKIKDSTGPLLMDYIKNSKSSQSEKFAVSYFISLIFSVYIKT